MSAPATAPLQVEWIPGRVGSSPGHRLMVVLAAPGCAYAFTKAGGCTNCSFPHAFGLKRPIGADEYLAQLEAALEHIPAGEAGPVQLDLFVSGSFFNPAEVPHDAQRMLLERAAQDRRILRIGIETRPEFVSTNTIEGAMVAVQPAPGVEGPGVSPEVEVAIGLESADRDIRERRIHKGFSWRQFEKAAGQLARSGANMLTYLLLKPMATGEREAIEDVVRSAERVFELGDRLGLPTRVALEPCFVGPDTVLEQAFERGEYRPPWLWSVVEVVGRIAGLGAIQVGLSDEGLNPQRAAHNCERCSARVRGALAAFNLDQDPQPLTRLTCDCRAEWSRAAARVN